MAFGLCNAPATFQRTMNLILSDLRDFCLVYIDDIVVFSRNLQEHLQHLCTVLQRLREQKLFAKRSKCTFAQDKIDHVGFIVWHGGIRPHPSKLKAIVQFPKMSRTFEVFLSLLIL